MKRIITILLLALVMLAAFAPLAHARVSVRGYYRSSGTYVMPHYRSSPDRSYWNNWSSGGNYNPYTGSSGYRSYSSYLSSKYGW